MPRRFDFINIYGQIRKVLDGGRGVTGAAEVSMNRRAGFLFASALILAPGCKKKEAETSPAEGGGGVLKGAMVPDDDNAKAFARNLVTHKATDIRPMDNGEMSFIYKSLTFTAENNGWMADAVVGQGQDSLPCQELGDWKIESADSETSATMVWTLNKTTCAGRAPNNVMRVKVTIVNGNYDVAFR
jgi:hypothetical protein